MKLPFDLRALWERALAWYNGYSQRDRRWILGVLIAVGLSIVYLGVIEPILDYRKAVGREISDGQFELERAMRFVGAKDTLRAEREDLRKRLTQAKGRLLPGGTATLGAAALQERANALASEKHIAVQSTQVMKEENVDPFRKVAVRLTLSGELEPFAELVSALEYKQQLSVPFVEVSRRGAVAGAKGPRTLSITLEVSGFVQAGAAGKADGAEAEAATAAGEGTAPATGEAEAPADGAVPPAEGTAPPNPAAPLPNAGTPPTEGGPGAAIAPLPLDAGVAPAPGAPDAIPPPGAAVAPGVAGTPGVAVVPVVPPPLPPPAPGAITPTTLAVGTPPGPSPTAAATVTTPSPNAGAVAAASTLVPITFPPMNLPAPIVSTTLAPAAPAPPAHPRAEDQDDDEDGE